MKIKKDFILRQIVDDYILVPVGKTASTFNGLISINEIGAFIWRNIECSEEEILDLILNEYDVDKNIAEKDMKEFLNELRNSEIIQ